MGLSTDVSNYLNNCVNRVPYGFHLFGEGLEIGALAWPLSLPEGARCRYVDINSTEDLKRTYGEYKDLIVPVDVQNDGTTLESFSEHSQDFIIANHILEHVVNVIRTLMRWYNVLRVNGVLFVSIPDWRLTWDHVRQRTNLSHLVDDFHRNITEVPDEHCIEHLTACNRIPGDQIVPSMIQQCKKEGVHNHCWECEDILQLFEVLFDRYGVIFQLLDLSLPKGLYNEFILVLQKNPQAKEFWTEFAKRRYEIEKEIERAILSRVPVNQEY
jgi:hypothetical protein